MTRRGSVVEIKVGEAVDLDSGRIRVTLEHKSGQRARLRIVADEAVSIERQRNDDLPPGVVIESLRGRG